MMANVPAHPLGPRAANPAAAQGQIPAAAAAQPLSVQNFASYLDQERRIREKEHGDLMAEMIRDRKQNTAFYQERIDQEARLLDRQQEEAEQRLAAEIAQTVPRCDGATPDSVRNWLKEIDMTVPYTDRTVVVACKSATGLLKEEIEHHLGPNANRTRASWPLLKTHLQQSFLTPEEAERYKCEVEHMKQGPYETTGAYGRRFRRTADAAYPRYAGAQRNDTEKRLLWKHYVGGLKNTKMADRIINEGKDTDYEVAIKQAEKFEANQHRIKMVRGNAFTDTANQERDEEPMDVNAVTDPNSQTTEFRDMKRQVSGMANQITKMTAMMMQMQMDLAQSRQQPSQPPHRASYQAHDPIPPAQDAPRHPPRSSKPRHQQAPTHARAQDGQWPSNDYAYAENGAPVCSYCNKIGHTVKICRMRLRHRTQQQQAPRNQSSSGEY